MSGAVRVGLTGGVASGKSTVSAILAELGIRYVMVSRHGFGGSGPLPGRTLKGFAGDVAQLADALNRERFAVVGVAAATTDRGSLLTAGVAGLVAGAVSMALGEYVSVSTQRDTERALIAKETRELADEPEEELSELADLYFKKGLSPELARQVAAELTEKYGAGAVQRGNRWYTAMRCMQLKPMRLPKPQVKRREFPTL